MCIHKPSPPLPNLLHMCTQPRGFRLRFFTGHVFGPPFTSRRHISHAAYFVFPIFFCWQAAYLGCVLFDVEGGQAAQPPWSTQIFSLMHQRWQIDPKYAELKSEIYHQGFNFSKIFFLLQRSGRCGATCSKSTATWRSLSFYPREADRQSFILKKFMYL